MVARRLNTGHDADDARHAQASGRRATRRDAQTDSGRRRRELSQNYLRDPAAARRFLRSVELEPDTLCLEVGAGEGILTAPLSARCRAVIAYEVDQSLVPRLRARIRGRDNVRIVAGDFLAARQPSTAFQVVGNAPFSLTAPIVDWCLRSRRMTSATIITQLEYAKKRTGAYGRWSLLTVSTWPLVRWELLGTIPRAHFRPVPSVDAGILLLERRRDPIISPARQAAYRRLVQAGFTGVGGSVQASLRRFYPADRVAVACAAAGLGRRSVVAFVSPDQWVQIFRALDDRP